MTRPRRWGCSSGRSGRCSPRSRASTSSSSWTTAPTDTTTEVLEPYARVLPLTVIRHPERRGYAASVEALLRKAVELTDRPKRDAAILMHADFTHNPQTIPDLVRRIESGADLVVAEGRLEGETSRARRAGAPPRAGAAARHRHGARRAGPGLRLRGDAAGGAPERDPEPAGAAARDRWLGGERRALLAGGTVLPADRGGDLGRAARPPEPAVARRGVVHARRAVGRAPRPSGPRPVPPAALEPSPRREVEAEAVSS